MHTIITGGFGFIGKALCRSLIQAGHQVTILDLAESTQFDPVYHTGAEYLIGDVADPTTWKKLPPADYLYHLAAPSSIKLFEQAKTHCVKVTLQGLMNAFAWAETQQLKKLIYPSSGSIFGPQPTACTELTIPRPANIYGQTKVACEAIAKIYAETVPSLGLRIFAGYGPGEKPKGEIASVVTLFLNALQRGEAPVIYGDGSQTRDFVYIDDVVAALQAALLSPRTGVLNVGSGEATSFKALVDLLNQKLHTHLQPQYIHKPTNYLENTLSDTTQLRVLLGRAPLSLIAGLDRYLSELSDQSKTGLAQASTGG